MAKSYGERIPSLTDDSVYSQWKKEVNWWKFSTQVDKKKQAHTMVLAMNGKPRHIATQLDPDKLHSDTGLADLIAELDKHYLKDNTQSLFCAIDAFEKYTRPKGTSIDEYISEFTRLNGIVVESRSLSQAGGEKKEVYEDGLLAYKLLQQSNLTIEEQRLVRATTTKLEFKTMTESLKRTYGDSMSTTKLASSLSYTYNPAPIVKEEPTYYQQSGYFDESYGDKEEEDGKVYYTKFGNNQYGSGRPWQRPWQKRRGSDRGNDRFNPYGRNQQNNQQNQQNYNQQSVNKSNPSNFQRQNSGRKKRGCFICDDPGHFVSDCPHNSYKGGPERDSKTLLVSDSATMFVSDFSQLPVGEMSNKALLDTGASTTVCGKMWYKVFWDSLTTEEKDEVTTEKCRKSFNGISRTSVMSDVLKIIPVTICGQKMKLATYVIDNNIPLLLSRETMKAMKMILDIAEDKISINGTTENIQITESGHLVVPIGRCDDRSRNSSQRVHGDENLKYVRTDK
jgi:hypothetical protein